MDQQNWRGCIYGGSDQKTQPKAYIGYDDDAYKQFLRKKEDREKALAELVEEIDQVVSETGYYINKSGVLQYVHYANAYQLLFYCGDTVVVYVIHSQLPPETFGEYAAIWKSILIDTQINMEIVQGNANISMFPKCIWAMEGNLLDSLKKLPYLV